MSRLATACLAVASAIVCACAHAQALAPATRTSRPPTLESKGTVQVAFTPWDDAEGVVVDAIRRARTDIRVQAFSFTSRALATALISARRRGVDVKVIADAHQSSAGESSRLAVLARAGIAVLLDSAYQSAHSKVMVIDAGGTEPTVVTGSYNWTYSAQYRNAENVLVLRGNPELARAYESNWERHAAGSTPYFTPD
jgi:phosphatidylserine/phosphatidylglycerophosphate/cardiolipin synthase-like enzyme